MLDLFSVALARLQHCVFKKGGKLSYAKAGAYRPICISSYVGKLFEKILYLRLDKYFASNGMVDMYQEGFTKNRSRVRSCNSGQKSAIFVLPAFVFNQLQIYCLHLCISILDFSIFTLVWKKYFRNGWKNRSERTCSELGHLRIKAKVQIWYSLIAYFKIL